MIAIFVCLSITHPPSRSPNWSQLNLASRQSHWSTVTKESGRDIRPEGLFSKTFRLFGGTERLGGGLTLVWGRSTGAFRLYELSLPPMVRIPKVRRPAPKNHCHDRCCATGCCGASG